MFKCLANTLSLGVTLKSVTDLGTSGAPWIQCLVVIGNQRACQGVVFRCYLIGMLGLVVQLDHISCTVNAEQTCLLTANVQSECYNLPARYSVHVLINHQSKCPSLNKSVCFLQKVHSNKVGSLEQSQVEQCTVGLMEDWNSYTSKAQEHKQIYVNLNN